MITAFLCQTVCHIHMAKTLMLLTYLALSTENGITLVRWCLSIVLIGTDVNKYIRVIYSKTRLPFYFLDLLLQANIF